MKEIYQQTVEEVLGARGKQGIRAYRVNRSKDPERSADGMSLQKERKKVFCRFSLNSIRIFWC